MGKDPAQTWAGDYIPLIFETLDSARHARCSAWLLQIKFLDCGMNLLWGTGRHARG